MSMARVVSPVFGQVVEEGEDVSHDDEDRPGPGLDQVSDLDDELVLGLELCGTVGSKLKSCWYITLT